MKLNKIKNISALLSLLSFGGMLSAQYMIIGNDSISVDQFKTEYKYGLENAGIQKTIATTQDFYLFQQFAADKKADTLASFREKMLEKEAELRAKYFFPSKIIDPIVQSYVQDNGTEKEVQVFILEKTAGDANNYQQIYNDVKSGKITIEDAITKYTKGSPKAIYIKPGMLDNLMYADIKNLGNNSYTKLYNTSDYIGFAKVLNSRPSLGYMIFGTISFPKNAESDVVKAKIYNDLKSGKSFQEVAKLYGANENEKSNGGIVMGSPTLPNEVYELFKGKKAGYYTPEPILYGDNYFVFNIYNIEPYAVTEKNKSFFLREMKNSLYAEILQDKMMQYLQSDSSYKVYPAFQQIKKSYANFANVKDAELLYQYQGQKVTVGELKKILGDKKSDAEKLSSAAWSDAMDNVKSQDLLRIYSQNFTKLKNVSAELKEFKKSLYSDYILSKYISDEIVKHPEWITDFYNKNKANYMWGERADGRVAIVTDQKLSKEISKEIKDVKSWDNLKKKYNGRLNEKKQVVVNFDQGEMSKDAEIFNKYKVPFKPGVFQTEMNGKTLVIAIDKILPASQMTQEEAADEIKDLVNEQKLIEIVAEQRAKTKITVQPEFIKDLEKNFKK